MEVKYNSLLHWVTGRLYLHYGLSCLLLFKIYLQVLQFCADFFPHYFAREKKILKIWLGLPLNRLMYLGETKPKWLENIEVGTVVQAVSCLCTWHAQECTNRRIHSPETSSSTVADWRCWHALLGHKWFCRLFQSFRRGKYISPGFGEGWGAFLFWGGFLCYPIAKQEGKLRVGTYTQASLGNGSRTDAIFFLYAMCPPFRIPAWVCWEWRAKELSLEESFACSE